MKEYSSIVQFMNENVKNLKNSIENYLNGDNGIISLSSNTNVTLTHKINDIANLIDNSDSILSQSCSHGQQQLHNNQLTLQQLAQHHSQNTTKSLQSLETNIAASKSNISKMIASALKALSEARTDRETVRSAHGDLLGEWRESSMQSAKDVQHTARDEGQTVHESLQHFTGEMQHFGTVEQSLAQQRTLVDDDGQNHVSDVAKQQSNIMEQSTIIAETNKQRLQAQEAFINNVMSSFQTLIQTQVQKLAAEADAAHTKLKMSNDGLQTTNASLDDSAKRIVDTVDSSNKSLATHVQLLQDNDNKIAEVMKNTTAKLERMADTCSQHQSNVSEYASRADEHMSKFASLDVEADNMFESIRNNGESCSKHLTETVQEEASASYRELSDNAADMMRYCNDTLIRDCSLTLDEIMKPRQKMLDTMHDGVQSITSTMSSGEEEVKKIAQSVVSEGDESAAYVLDCAKTFNNKVMKRRREQMEATKEKITLNVNKLSDVTNLNTTNSSVQVKAVKCQIEGYSTSVMNIHEEVVPVERRKVWEYSEDLTATPSDRDILENLSVSVDGLALHDQLTQKSSEMNGLHKNEITC